jgi:hypothetical protein
MSSKTAVEEKEVINVEAGAEGNASPKKGSRKRKTSGNNYSVTARKLPKPLYQCFKIGRKVVDVNNREGVILKCDKNLIDDRTICVETTDAAKQPIFEHWHFAGFGEGTDEVMLAPENRPSAKRTGCSIGEQQSMLQEMKMALKSRKKIKANNYKRVAAAKRLKTLESKVEAKTAASDEIDRRLSTEEQEQAAREFEFQTDIDRRLSIEEQQQAILDAQVDDFDESELKAAAVSKAKHALGHALDDRKRPYDPLLWSSEQFAAYLVEQNPNMFTKFKAVIISKGLDGKALHLLNQENLLKMGIEQLEATRLLEIRDALLDEEEKKEDKRGCCAACRLNKLKLRCMPCHCLVSCRSCAQHFADSAAEDRFINGDNCKVTSTKCPLCRAMCSGFEP